MSADRRAIETLLVSARRRRAALLALAGVCAAAFAALALLGIGRIGLLSWQAARIGGAACIAVGALQGLWRARRARVRIAHEVERHAPQCRNLLVTAAELLGARGAAGGGAAPRLRIAARPPVKPEIVRLVESRAAVLARGLDTGSLFPLRRSVLTALVAVTVWGGLASASAPRSGAADGPRPAVSVPVTAPVIEAVEILVTPPAYTSLPARTLVDPARLEVVAGSRIDVTVRARAASVMLSTLDGELELLPRAGGFGGGITAEADGFLALEPRAAARSGTRRLVGLIVVPDALPRVRITEPGQDLFLARAEGNIPLVATAQDDFGLDALRLTYTIVSGSGESFEFTEGELPGRFTRSDQRAWSVATELSPAALGLSLGDTVVYRAVARDRRPGAPEVESDAFVVEIVGSDASIAGGFAIDSDEERSALSQRMVIVKTERLLAARQSTSAEDYAAEARRIAAEQRLVRAEFVFMLGGEIEDEFEEAEQEHEVASGRLELRGRQEMSRAVQFMSRAGAMLTQADLEAALPLEQGALEALQSALARSRYILRGLSDRQSIDLLRRLTGSPGAARGDRDAAVAAADPELTGLRRLLAEIAAQASAPLGGDEAGAALSDLAEAVLRLDPSSVELQDAAADLAAAAAGVADAAVRLDRVMRALTTRLEARLPLAPASRRVDASLAGALVEEMDPTGGRR